MSNEGFIQLGIALVSGGLITALVKWRPEATSASVSASDAAVKMIERQLARMEETSVKLSERIAVLEDALSSEQAARIRAEREAAAATAKYQSERHRRREAEALLAELTLTRRTDDVSTSTMIEEIKHGGSTEVAEGLEAEPEVEGSRADAEKHQGRSIH